MFAFCMLYTLCQKSIFRPNNLGYNSWKILSWTSQIESNRVKLSQMGQVKWVKLSQISQVESSWVRLSQVESKVKVLPVPQADQKRRWWWYRTIFCWGVGKHQIWIVSLDPCFSIASSILSWKFSPMGNWNLAEQ